MNLGGLLCSKTLISSFCAAQHSWLKIFILLIFSPKGSGWHRRHYRPQHSNSEKCRSMQNVAAEHSNPEHVVFLSGAGHGGFAGRQRGWGICWNYNGNTKTSFGEGLLVSHLQFIPEPVLAFVCPNQKGSGPRGSPPPQKSLRCELLLSFSIS